MDSTPQTPRQEDQTEQKQKTNLSDFLRQPTPLPEDIKIPDKEPDKGKFAVTKDTLDWLKGNKSAPPSDIAMMMADVTNKISYFIAYSVIQRADGLSRLIQYLDRVEQRLFPENTDISVMSVDELEKKHRQLSTSINTFLELTRRFAAQSKDIIIDPTRDDLVNLIRSLDGESLTALRQVISTITSKKAGKTDPFKQNE